MAFVSQILKTAGSFFGRPSTKAVTNSDKGNGKRPRKLFVFFMTDGEDTCNDERLKNENYRTHSIL